MSGGKSVGRRRETLDIDLRRLLARAHIFSAGEIVCRRREPSRLRHLAAPLLLGGEDVQFSSDRHHFKKEKHGVFYLA